ncbi:hypothetical protein D8852_00850 [Streptococcus mitis]|jgi:hypothetical protein|uniref:Uncharacterized protein n=1 Tax=Streptococcus mitis TaxID=28037 RepID=A0A3R9KJQ0_STRMT|nr:SIR2 family protein [Streptococcus mitis]RSI83068.1 hypothetical protein D8852_00850 [Streptococcus mitis]RSJ08881.1 hypothetical protein D8839_01150 [Streptococcus mitis]
MENIIFNVEQFKRNILTKNLNILIGSGVSNPAIPLMKFFSKDDKGMTVSKEDANANLENHIWKVSSFLLWEHNDRIKYFVENMDKQTLYSTDYFTELKNFNTFENNIGFVLERYVKFLEKVITLLYTSNSRTVSKSVSIFTTNYDLFIENSLDLLMKNENFIFNDGSNGYFHKVLDSSNYNKSVAYRGLNENYLNELPSISLIKPHGSMNWEKGENNQILIRPYVVDQPVVVKPTGLEGQETYLNNHFHDMLRVFQLELDKPQSVLIVVGFSFQDDHIAKMVRRSLKNPELMIYIFCYADSDFEVIKNNLSLDNIPRNLQIVIPTALESENKNILNTSGNFDISSLTELFIIEDEEVK